MSYFLVFWKQKPGVELDPQTTDHRLLDGERVEALDELPTDAIMDRISAAFLGGWTRVDHQTWEAPGKYFQVTTHAQYFSVQCGKLSGEEMNVFIDLAVEFACRLYDPQLMKRFDAE